MQYFDLKDTPGAGAQIRETIPEPLSMTKAAEKKGKKEKEKEKIKQSRGFLFIAHGGGGCRGC